MLIGLGDRRNRFRPYPAYKDSGVEWLGEVPEHWEVKRLKFTLNPVNQKTDDLPDGAVYYALENIESWKGKLSPAETDFVPESQCNRFQSGDVLFGKLRPYLAKVLLTDTEGYCSTELLVLRGDQLRQSFLKYWCLSKDFIEIVDGSTYGSKMPRANWEFIGNLQSFIPLASEQSDIADFLDRETARIDTLVAKKERLIELLREKRAALITRAVTKGLDPTVPMKDSGVEWLGEIPEHWEVARISELTTLLNGYPFDSEFFTRGEGTPLVRIRDMNGEETEVNYFGSVVDSAWIEPGDVIIGMDGDFNVARWRGRRALLNQRLCCMRPCGGTDSGFIAYLLPLPLRVINDLTYSTTVKHLSSGDVRKVRLGAPPLSEQRAIAAFLDRETAKIDALVAKVREAIDRLKEYRTALISAAVTGKIDVREEVSH